MRRIKKRFSITDKVLNSTNVFWQLVKYRTHQICFLIYKLLFSEKDIPNYLLSPTVFSISYSVCSFLGGKPKRLPVLDQNELLKSKCTYFRTAEDFFRLRDLVKHFKSVAVIGGGFLGSELSCSIAFQVNMNNSLLLRMEGLSFVLFRERRQKILPMV